MSPSDGFRFEALGHENARRLNMFYGQFVNARSFLPEKFVRKGNIESANPISFMSVLRRTSWLWKFNYLFGERTDTGDQWATYFLTPWNVFQDVAFVGPNSIPVIRFQDFSKEEDSCVSAKNIPTRDFKLLLIFCRNLIPANKMQIYCELEEGPLVPTKIQQYSTFFFKCSVL